MLRCDDNVALHVVSGVCLNCGELLLTVSLRWAIAVGRPVTRPPPHGSRRARLPHLAFQAYSLPQHVLLSPSVRLALECSLPYGLRGSLPLAACIGRVRFNYFVRLSPPNSCNTRYEWLARPASRQQGLAPCKKHQVSLAHQRHRHEPRAARSGQTVLR